MKKRKQTKESPIAFREPEKIMTMKSQDVISIPNPTPELPLPTLRSNATKPLSFNEAFAKARKEFEAGGPNTFTWMGNSYSTALASDSKPLVLKRQTQEEVKPKEKNYYQAQQAPTKSPIINTTLKNPYKSDKQKNLDAQKIIQYAGWQMKNNAQAKNIPINYKAAVNSYIADLRKRANLKQVDSSEHPRNIAIQYGERHALGGIIEYKK